jgi:phosphomevalonate kinase
MQKVKTKDKKIKQLVHLEKVFIDRLHETNSLDYEAKREINELHKIQRQIKETDDIKTLERVVEDLVRPNTQLIELTE